MATIDLGKIKQVFRGTYNNATAYTVDDLVSFTDTVGGLQNTSTYIAVANTTGNAPASGGTIHASWNLVAQGVPDRLPSQSGNSGKFLKTDGSALSFATAGGVIGMKEIEITNLQTLSLSDTGWTGASSAYEISYTASSTTSYFLLEAFLSLGTEHHDLMYSMNWWDSLKGLSDGNELFTLGATANNRKRGTFGTIPSGAGVSAEWDSYWLSGVFFSALYYPAVGQRSTSARTFKPCFRRNGYNYNMIFNYSHTDNGVGMTGISKVRVTEIEGGIIQ